MSVNQATALAPVLNAQTCREYPPPLTSAVRIPALDGLRGIAIGLVILRHAFVGMQTDSLLLRRLLNLGQLTWSGVDLFFVLSGFLIGGILLDTRSSPAYFKTFYVRRAYRILPLYAVVTFVFLVRHLPFRGISSVLGAVSPLTIPWASYVTFTQNFWMVGLSWYGPKAMAVTWSLAVEEQFYLTIPVVIRKLRQRWLATLLLAVVVVAPVLRLWLRTAIPNGDFACYVLMPCRADALCVGVFAAMVVRNRNMWTLLFRRRKVLLSTCLTLFCGFAFMTYMQYEQFSEPMTTWGYSLLAMFYMCCLLVAITTPARGYVERILCNRKLMGLGTLAYCTYLVHFPLIDAGRRLTAPYLPQSVSWLLGGWMGVAGAVGFAALSWKYFERPLLRQGHRYQY